MKAKLFLFIYLLSLPVVITAQDYDDDLYYVPSKKTTQRVEVITSPSYAQSSITYGNNSDYSSSAYTQDVDEYNRRGRYRQSSVSGSSSSSSIVGTADSLATAYSAGYAQGYGDAYKQGYEDGSYDSPTYRVRFVNTYDPFWYDSWYYPSYYYDPWYYGSGWSISWGTYYNPWWGYHGWSYPHRYHHSYGWYHSTRPYRPHHIGYVGGYARRNDRGIGRSTYNGRTHSNPRHPVQTYRRTEPVRRNNNTSTSRSPQRSYNNGYSSGRSIGSSSSRSYSGGGSMGGGSRYSGSSRSGGSGRSGGGRSMGRGR